MQKNTDRDNRKIRLKDQFHNRVRKKGKKNKKALKKYNRDWKFGSESKLEQMSRRRSLDPFSDKKRSIKFQKYFKEDNQFRDEMGNERMRNLENLGDYEMMDLKLDEEFSLKREQMPRVAISINKNGNNSGAKINEFRNKDDSEETN